MRFLIDAQLPRALSDLLQSYGFDSIHTLDLPGRNSTPDKVLNQVSIDQQRIVVSKDNDFLTSFLLNSVPYKLLLVKVGNISNRELTDLFLKNLDLMVRLLSESDLIELYPDEVIQHR